MAKRKEGESQPARRISGEIATPVLIPQPNGGALLSGGVPGHDGSNAGRPPKKFSTFMRELRESPNVQAALQRAAEDENSKGFAPVLAKMAEYDKERPGVKLEHTGADGAPMVVKIVREGRRTR